MSRRRKDEEDRSVKKRFAVNLGQGQNSEGDAVGFSAGVDSRY